ncbi:MAG: Eco57I restriction-modification methylase domain-containing protein, partial [Candidatus Binatia bacterium]
DGTKALVSYRDLAIRDLGSIYEGLLEYRLKLTPANALDLVTDKGERKATGSYYTPDYIVTYIVENILVPLIQEKKERVGRQIQELKEKFKKSRGYNREAFEKQLKEAEGYLIDEILSLKVLDPAMGSGHFLVEATDYLARALVEALSGFLLEDGAKAEGVKEPPHRYGEKESDEDDIRWARREVIEKCIYGVDLNPLAVELAKLSLWLSTVAKDKPLSFLDHHLRCGNSLIGAKIKDLARLPKTPGKKTKAQRLEEAGQITVFEHVFREKVSLLLKDFELIESSPSETVEQIKKKENLYEDFRQRVRRFQEVADIWTSVYFGNQVGRSNFQSVQEKLRVHDEEWKALHEKPWFRGGLDIAEKRHFFHWELEFPEVFFEGAREKENPGFDAVIGNPPYGSIGDASYIRLRYPTTQQNSDAYVAFIERALSSTRQGGWPSYIVPVTWQTGVSYADLRDRLLKETRIQKLVNLPFDVFPEAYVDTCVAVFQNFPCDADTTAHAFAFPKKTKVPELSSLHYHVLRQADWSEGKRTVIINPTELSLLRKLLDPSLTHSLGSVTNSARGILAGRDDISSESQDSSWKLFFDKEMDRYVQDEPSKYVRYGGNLPEHPSSFDFFQGERLLIRRLVSRQDRLMATLATKTFVNKKDIYNFKSASPTCRISFLLALVNSRLLSFTYLQQDVAATKDDFRQTTLDGLRALPVSRIDFNTPKRERIQLFEKGKALYERCLAKNDFLCVTGFVDHHLKQKPEQADVVHDLLAFLAEQMIEMNKEKQAETSGFLQWLEMTIAAKIDNLKNKTKIRAYHEGSLEDLLEILKGNRKTLKANPASKDFYDLLKDGFQKSFNKLAPLKARIATTDRLIDLIVYRLYGLTEEEVKIVEGA